MTDQWYYRQTAAEFGPYTSAQLRQLAQSGRITAATLVRPAKNGDWILASQVKSLWIADRPKAARLANVPPPLPPRPSSSSARRDGSGRQSARRAGSPSTEENGDRDRNVHRRCPPRGRLARLLGRGPSEKSTCGDRRCVGYRRTVPGCRRRTGGAVARPGGSPRQTTPPQGMVAGCRRNRSSRDASRPSR